MNVTPINNSQNFKSLNYHNVSSIDRNKFIRANFKELKELGKKYDIRLTSCYADVPDFSAIDIDIKPLKKEFGFFKRFFRPTGKSSFKTGYVHIDEPLKSKEDFMKSVYEAVSDLKEKLKTC